MTFDPPHHANVGVRPVKMCVCSYKPFSCSFLYIFRALVVFLIAISSVLGSKATSTHKDSN